MDDNEDDTEAAANELLDRMSRDGVAVSTVRDGVILAITRKSLERVLEEMNTTGRSEAVIFVKVGAMAEVLASTRGGTKAS